MLSPVVMPRNIEGVHNVSQVLKTRRSSIPHPNPTLKKHVRTRNPMNGRIKKNKMRSSETIIGRVANIVVSALVEGSRQTEILGPKHILRTVALGPRTSCKSTNN